MQPLHLLHFVAQVSQKGKLAITIFLVAMGKMRVSHIAASEFYSFLFFS